MVISCKAFYILRHAYCMLYTSVLSIRKDTEWVKWNVIAILSLAIFMNLLTLGIVVQLFNGPELVLGGHMNKLEFAAMYLIIYTTSCFIILGKSSSREMINEYKEKATTKIKRNGYLIWAYIVASYAIAAIIAYVYGAFK